MMDFVELGKTGLRVSVAGLGCGGHSRLGQSQNASVEKSVDLVRAAMDMGINFIDTAAAYGTEEIVGKAILGNRDKVVISTKAAIVRGAGAEKEFVTAKEFRDSFDTSLRRLQTDYVDVFHLHAVGAEDYAHCQTHLRPVMEDLRDQGKIRFLGVTERFIEDPAHEALNVVLNDGGWDVVMVGFNMLNPSARKSVFKSTGADGVGTLGMFAVRRALSNPDALKELLKGLIKRGEIPNDAAGDDPLGFLLQGGDATSISNAAYRFCRHEAGVDVVLTGTGNVDHLRENVASINQAPLCTASLKRLASLFGNVDSVSGN